jgi:hypothetical protein
MDEKEILSKIIEEDGSCCWANKHICEQCPLSKLKKKSDDTYFSCIEATGSTGISEEEQDLRYKEIATRILLDMSIEEYILK